MLNFMDSTRYNRQIILPEVGHNGQDKLQQASVLIVGLGGLGAAVLPYLAGAGIGTIGLIDDDVIELSNLQRQLIYKTESVGKSKVAEAKIRALEINPNLDIQVFFEKITSHNALSLLSQYDIIVDGTDNLSTKYLINDACLVCNKPFVYGSVYKFEGQVAVFNYKKGPTYRCVFPEDTAAVKSCNEAGVLGVSVGIIGLFQANEVLKMILGIGDILSGKLLIYNCLTTQQQKFEIAVKETVLMDKKTFNQKYNLASGINFEVSVEEALEQINNSDALFLDVRNPDELPKFKAKNCIQIPLSQLETMYDKLDVNKKIIVLCQSGVRSKAAVAFLLKKEITTAVSIIGGMNAIVKFNNIETVLVS